VPVSVESRRKQVTDLRVVVHGVEGRGLRSSLCCE